MTVDGKAHQRCTTIKSTGTKTVQNARAATTARANALATTNGPRTLDVSPLCAQGYYDPDRFTSCSQEGWVITETETVDGVTEPVGTLPLTIDASAQFGTDDTANWTLSVSITVGEGQGTLLGGTGGSMSTACGRTPTVCETSTGSEGQPITLASNTTHTAEWDQYDNGPAVTTANTVDTLNGYLGVILDLDEGLANPVEINDAANNTLYGRCDSVNPGLDCVDQYAPIAVAFDATSNAQIGPVADHVYTAQATLPSHWGNPNYAGSALTRTTDQTVIDANRAAACAGVAPSCDEYPMATTYQGASRSAPGDWSAVTVPDSANDSQGGVMSQFTRFDRVVDGDPYYVLAVRSDGSQSW
ncbi:NucA/NucB deoxyribonuclease domain-containing protein [Amycolatopsis acidicola]|uniref:NucA/NucB deoxyribonuclease domain-containing protein n=1 Tax=Amycolatopsis acidicola TaxID=2596893 RepID=UPI001408C4C2|nr:NucA/NucB deoxyribonuclease domain-containing protein [Amycolatopsis acidicola]